MRADGLFPLAGVEESVQKIGAIYRKAEAAAAFASRFYDVPQLFNIAMQDEAVAWFGRHLKF